MCWRSAWGRTKELVKVVLDWGASEQDPALAAQGLKGGHGLATLSSFQPAHHACLLSLLTSVAALAACTLRLPTRLFDSSLLPYAAFSLLAMLAY